MDCTNPIREKKDIYGAINLLKKSKKADGCISICKAKKNPYFSMVEKSKKNMLKISKPLKYQITFYHLWETN